MANKRSTGSQSKHDKKVKEVAQDLQKKGYKVKADIPGFDQPSPIGKNNRVPDIEATKGNRTKLIEVETKDTISTDKAQQSTFRRSAAQKPNTTFEVKEI
jgi:hypothetical protein